MLTILIAVLGSGSRVRVHNLWESDTKVLRDVAKTPAPTGEALVFRRGWGDGPIMDWEKNDKLCQKFKGTVYKREESPAVR